MPRTTAPWQTLPEWLVRAEDETDSRHGCIPEERPAENFIKYGLINLDKPAGPSSHEVAAWVKRIVKHGHVGHGGTLEVSA